MADKVSKVLGTDVIIKYFLLNDKSYFKKYLVFFKLMMGVGCACLLYLP